MPYTERNPKRLLNKTVGGLATHMAIKMTFYTVVYLLFTNSLSDMSVVR